MMTDEDILRIFTYHPATEVTGPLHDQIRNLLHDTAAQLVQLVPDCPERVLAVRALQQAMMFANAGIAIHTPLPKEEKIHIDFLHLTLSEWLPLGPAPRVMSKGIKQVVTMPPPPFGGFGLSYEGTPSEHIPAGTVVEWNRKTHEFRCHWPNRDRDNEF